MSIDTTMKMGGRVQFPDVIASLGTVFSDASLASGDGWQEVDVSSYVPKGCRCAICTAYIRNSADGDYVMGYSTNGTSGVGYWVGVQAADDAGTSVSGYFTFLCPLNNSRKFWVQANRDTMALTLYLRGWLEP
jgi:hypothetical protein